MASASTNTLSFVNNESSTFVQILEFIRLITVSLAVRRGEPHSVDMRTLMVMGACIRIWDPFLAFTPGILIDMERTLLELR